MQIQAKLATPPPPTPPPPPVYGRTRTWVLGSGSSSAYAFDAGSKTWHVELDHGAPVAGVSLAHSDVLVLGAYTTGAGQDGDGHVAPLISK
jgi:hypothetical protein